MVTDFSGRFVLFPIHISSVFSSEIQHGRCVDSSLPLILFYTQHVDTIQSLQAVYYLLLSMKDRTLTSFSWSLRPNEALMDHLVRPLTEHLTISSRTLPMEVLNFAYCV